MTPPRILPILIALFSPFLSRADQPGTHLLPQSKLASHYYGPNAPWFKANIPFFDCSDPQITQIYYYRWQLYQAHLKDLGQHGYIVTEFLDDVSWARPPYQSLNDATAFHIDEGRWLRDPRYIDDYINFMSAGGNDRHFSESIAAAVYSRYLANGDRDFAVKNLGAMKHIYHLWRDHLDPSKGLYFIEPLLDATEYSVASIDASGGHDGFRGGDAFRPTINSFMYANAVALNRLATLAGDTTADEFAADAATLRANVESNLWNDQLQDFVDRYKVDNQYVHYWDFIRTRELCGYVPWAFELPDADPKYNAAWTWLLSTNDFAGPSGLRTVAPSYQYYMRQYRYDTVNGVKRPECEWNGPAWPFDTTLVLQAIANLLNDYHQDLITSQDYVRLLKQYTRQHYLGDHPDLQEDYNPDTGNVIVGLPRSHHYNHSEYNDLIITGLVGLRPRADDTLEINPLIPTGDNIPATNTLDYFCLENVPYHGHLLTILYDHDGHHYQQGSGLTVYVDGNRVLKSAPLGKQLIPFGVPPSGGPGRGIAPIDLAVNCARKGFPVPSASANNNPRDLFRAIDGRVWFFPEIPNYWSNAGSTNPTDWYALDFDTEKEFTSAQLYFYADATHFAAPKKFVLQYFQDGAWQNLPHEKNFPSHPLANGENTVTFLPIKTTKLRALFTNPPNHPIALVELKLFGPAP